MSRMRPSTREWLSARSHVHTDFDAADLVTRLEAKGQSVAVVVPARNEAATCLLYTSDAADE